MIDLRLIEEIPALSSAEGLAGDEALAMGVGDGTSPPTLRLYRYRPSVIVGRYQNLTDAVNLEECKRRGHEWNRRHTGGGTVLMGPDQVAVALVLPDGRGRSLGGVREHFHFFAGVLADALGAFGIAAGLEGKNDLQVAGRKIAGLAISQDIGGAAFFHCSLLLDFDVELMVHLLNLPTHDLADKGQSCFSQRMTTVHAHAPHVTFDQMKSAIAQALERHLSTAAQPGTWLPHELDRMARLRRERYGNDAWIHSSRVMRRWTGTAECKTPGGTLRVYVDRAGGALDAVLITGDYFSRGVEIATLEARLRGVPARPEAILAVIGECGCDRIYRVGARDLTDLIVAAAQRTGPRVCAIAAH
jgi:lipoate-protein ligase A